MYIGSKVLNRIRKTTILMAGVIFQQRQHDLAFLQLVKIHEKDLVCIESKRAV